MAIHATPGAAGLATRYDGIGRIYGTASRQGAPARRLVRLYDRRTGDLVRQIWSEPASGAYAFDWIAMRPYGYTVIEYDLPLDLLATPFNACIRHFVTPERMP